MSQEGNNDMDEIDLELNCRSGDVWERYMKDSGISKLDYVRQMKKLYEQEQEKGRKIREEQNKY